MYRDSLFLHVKLKLEVLDNAADSETSDVPFPSSSCPVYLSLSVLGRHFVTRDVQPVFPVVLDQAFTLERDFAGVFALPDLDAVLEAEVVYMELVARSRCHADVVLATFETSARQLLFSQLATLSRRAYSTDLDLILEPTDNCREQVVPKLQLSVDVFVHEPRATVVKRRSSSHSDLRKVNSSRKQAKSDLGRPWRQSLCDIASPHKPVFSWRRADQSLIGRMPGATPTGAAATALPRQPTVVTVLAGDGRGRHCHCACAEKTNSLTGGDNRRRRVRSRSVTSADARRVTFSDGPVSPARAGCTCKAHQGSAERRCIAEHCQSHCSVCSAYYRRFGRPYPQHYAYSVPRPSEEPNECSAYCCRRY